MFRKYVASTDECIIYEFQIFPSANRKKAKREIWCKKSGNFEKKKKINKLNN